MFLKKPILLTVVVAVLIVGAACTSSPATPTLPLPTQEQESLPAQPGEDQPEAAQIPGRPTAPAAPEEYRADPASVIAATGRPQFIEFFSYN